VIAPAGAAEAAGMALQGLMAPAGSRPLIAGELRPGKLALLCFLVSGSQRRCLGRAPGRFRDASRRTGHKTRVWSGSKQRSKSEKHR